MVRKNPPKLLRSNSVVLYVLPMSKTRPNSHLLVRLRHREATLREKGLNVSMLDLNGDHPQPKEPARRGS